jgi:hypothetical protein
MSAAAVAATTTVEPAATTTVEPAATAAMEPTTAAVESATVNSATASESATTVEPPPTGEPMAAVKTATAESTTTVEPATAIEAAASETPAAEPRSSADKDAAYKVVRAVVSVRCASIGIVTVISVTTNGCSTIVAAHWTDSDAHGPLRVGVRRGNQGKCQTGTENSQILQVTHFMTSRQTRDKCCVLQVPASRWSFPIGVPHKLLKPSLA